jgi:hypothetical protein
MSLVYNGKDGVMSCCLVGLVEVKKFCLRSQKSNFTLVLSGPELFQSLSVLRLVITLQR